MKLEISPSSPGENSVVNSQLAQMAANTIKGNNTGSTANAADLTVTQVSAMFHDATSNVYLGSAIATTITSATDNTIIGANAGGALTGGLRNTSIGEGSLPLLNSGNDNTCIGHEAGLQITTASNNTF